MTIPDDVLLGLGRELQLMDISQERIAGIHTLIIRTNATIAQAAEKDLCLDDHPSSYALWASQFAPRT